MSDGVVHSVDLFNTVMPWPPYNYGYLKNPLEFAQKSAVAAELAHRIRFHKMDSNDLGEQFTEKVGEAIDFLFIDGDHSVAGCVNDFVLFYPHVRVGGYIMLHDIYPRYCGWEGPRYVIDNFIRKSPHFTWVEIDTSPNNFGMVLVRKLSEDSRLCSRGNMRVQMNRAKTKLAKTRLWSNIRGRYVGKLIKRIVG